MARPFLKWAGGKRQLLPEIEARLPHDIAECTTYVEPFIGGGAVLFHLLEEYDFDFVHISDLNPELTLCYRMLQTDALSVARCLQGLIDDYPTIQEERAPTYYAIRDDWNLRVDDLQSLSHEQEIARAAQTLFLNKTCFNGLFRVNSSGRFNVPIGSYVNPSFQTEEELLRVQDALQGVTIHTSPFQDCVDWVDDSSFVYFDPPYRPLSDTSNFVSYARGDFDDDDQEALSETFRELHSRGARILLSNSDPKNTEGDDEFFDDMYADFTIERVYASRAINSNASRRGSITELLIRNYRRRAAVSEELWSESYDDGYTLQMMRGDRLGPLDVKVTHQHEGARRAHAPKHLHWVDDLLRKAEVDHETMCELMNWALENYEEVSAWSSEAQQTGYAQPVLSLRTEHDLPGWSLQHLLTLLDIFSRNERLGSVGNPNVFRFRQLMEQVRDYVCGGLEDADLRRTILSDCTY